MRLDFLTGSLVEMGTLTPVQVKENNAQSWSAYLPTSALPLLDQAWAAPRVIFMAPLDSLLWDRRAVAHLYDFVYTWEVYKPEPQRRWGYYVLPVFYGDRFVARLDSRLERGLWTISRWWWEPSVTPTSDLFDALSEAASAFLSYLHARGVSVAEGIDPAVRQVFSRAFARLPEDALSPKHQ